MAARRLVGTLAHAASATLPSDIPAAACLRLPRSLIAVSGRDSAKFLNGLLTVRPPDNAVSSRPAGSYAGMLTAKGRVLADLFVYSAHDVRWVREQLQGPRTGPCYLIDVDSQISDRILQTLKFYKLISDVSIQEVPQVETWFAWDDEDGDDGLAAMLSLPQSALSFPDYRVPALGTRVLSPEGLDVSSVKKPVYDIRRYLFGVPEGPAEFVPEKALPLEYCMDYMNGIDFNKGCYVGQELTIRTHHHGVVRKRVAPVIYTEGDAPVPEGLYEPVEVPVPVGGSIIDSEPLPNSEGVVNVFPGSDQGHNPFGSSARLSRPAGSVVAALGNVGLASLRIDKLGHRFSISANGEPVHVHPLKPFWWPEPEPPN